MNTPEIYIVLRGCDERSAHMNGLPQSVMRAHMSYRLCDGMRLARQGLPETARGGAMVFTDEDFCGSGDDYGGFASQVAAECDRRGYRAVAADIERCTDDAGARLIGALAGRLERRGLALFVPERFGDVSASARVMISTAISGGSLEQRLWEAAERFGSGRLAMELQRTAMDFLMPSPGGVGRELTLAQLEELMSEPEPMTFYSRELCAHYFTYKKGDENHFVLFDTIGSMSEKLKMAARLKIGSVFLIYPEIADILRPMLAFM